MQNRLFPGLIIAEVSEVDEVGKELKRRIYDVLGRSVYVLRVDTGSCNGCEIEIFATLAPQIDIERFGIRLVASPRHADVMLVTGPVTRQYKPVLLNVYEQMPDPKVVVAVGACACGGGIWYNSYAVEGGVPEVIPVDAFIPGCPPSPYAILYGMLVALDVLEQKIRHQKCVRMDVTDVESEKLDRIGRGLITDWELVRELEITCRKHLGYIQGLRIFHEYMDILERIENIDELAVEINTIVDKYDDPRITNVIDRLNEIVKRHTARA